MKNYDLSIVVPVYNVEKFLLECLDSLRIENINYQVIIVNDGSTDKSTVIAEEFVKKNDKFILINQNNGGLSVARNTGLLNSSGEYICFIDSDDFINSETIKKMLKVALLNKVDIVNSKCSQVTESSSLVEMEKISEIKLANICEGVVYESKEFILKQLETDSYQTIVCLNMYRREFLISNNMFFVPNMLHEDEEWMPKVLLGANTVMYVDEEFYYYRNRANSITTVEKSKRNFDHLTQAREKNFELYSKIEDEYFRKKLMNNLVKRRLYDYAVCHQSQLSKRDKVFLWKYSYSIKNKLKLLYFSLFPNKYIQKVNKRKVL